MTQKNQAFAFIVGEVSPAYYGRLDLQKYPLGLAEVENFFIDYHGGLFNRAGSEFIGMLEEQPHKFARFKSKAYDLTLFFTELKMRVLLNGHFIRTAADAAGTIVSGVVTAANTLTVGQLVWVDEGTFKGYFEVTAQTAGTFTITSPIGQIIPNGAVTWSPVYELATTFDEDILSAMSISQDLKRVVVTCDTMLPVFIERVADNNWNLTTFSNTLPAAPTGLAGAASGVGAASVGFAVTAVVNGIESASSTVLVTSSIINYSTTTGYFTLTWSSVAGAERYNVYRSLIYPAAYPTGAQLGYVGYTTGLSFVDQNITADNTKTIPAPVDPFDSNNYPAVYTRFQQRGVYAGLANDPLTVVGSIANDKGKFSVTFPPTATDSYSYTIDAESERPIKHMLSLRYGLMLFTDDGITQLRGAENGALSATSALAEVQGFVSVSDLSPIAINMDVLFMTELNSELNQMLYTEYTNSFKMQDILVLSTHLFSSDNQAVQMSWAPEPHKLLHFVREDGQRITLTYERNLEVYGWSRYRTQGDYLQLEVVKDSGHNLAYQTVRRKVKNTSVMFLERERPRNDMDYSKMWFVDAGVERPLLRPVQDGVLKMEIIDDEEVWTFTPTASGWAAVDRILYVGGGMFRITSVSSPIVYLAVMVRPTISEFYKKNELRALSQEWGYNTKVSTLDGLWWLDEETVSVQSDGDADIDTTVVDSTISITNGAAYIVAGLGYRARAKTLPLSLPNYVLGGFPMSLRGMALRQLNSRGLAVGASYETMEELPSRQDEAWGNPLSMFSELTVHELWGANGWELDQQIHLGTNYPLPAAIIGFTFDLDVGE